MMASDPAVQTGEVRFAIELVQQIRSNQDIPDQARQSGQAKCA
jgi:hypothetical protein